MTSHKPVRSEAPKTVIAQAIAALAALDADCLEELVEVCKSLLDAPRTSFGYTEFIGSASDAKVSLETFERVLWETRANLRVLSQLPLASSAWFENDFGDRAEGAARSMRKGRELWGPSIPL